jgi:hypothetical protein
VGLEEDAMHDRTARQIRDLLLCMLWIQLAILAVGILLLSIAGYWHFKADAARQRLLDPPPQVSQARSDRPSGGTTSRTLRSGPT